MNPNPEDTKYKHFSCHWTSFFYNHLKVKSTCQYRDRIRIFYKNDESAYGSEAHLCHSLSHRWNIFVILSKNIFVWYIFVWFSYLLPDSLFSYWPITSLLDSLFRLIAQQFLQIRRKWQWSTHNMYECNHIITWEMFLRL